MPSLLLLLVILLLTPTSCAGGEEKEVEGDPETDEGGGEGKAEGAQTGFLFLGDGEGRTGQSSSGVATKVLLSNSVLDFDSVLAFSYSVFIQYFGLTPVLVPIFAPDSFCFRLYFS